MKLKFKGNSTKFVLVSILLSIVSVITLGLLLPYQLYWTVKFFIDGTELVNEVSTISRYKEMHKMSASKAD